MGCGSNLATPSLTGVRTLDTGVTRYSPEHAFLLPSTPDEVREEVDLLLSDLIVRLKQLLFNSLLCAYYVGFIPVQFADVSIVDKYYCVLVDYVPLGNSGKIGQGHVLLTQQYLPILVTSSLGLGVRTGCINQ